MAQHPVDEWFALKIQQSARMAHIGAISLIPLAILAAIGTWLALAVPTFLAIWFIQKSPNWILTAVIASGGLALTFAWQFFMARGYQESFEFAGRTFTGWEWAMIRAAGSGWAVFVFDPHLGTALTRFLSALLITAPRMLELSRELRKRRERLENANVAGCAKVVKRMVKTQKRVTLEDIEKNLPGEDHASLLQSLTDVDGIIFLTKNGTGITLAPRLNTEFQEWLAEREDLDASEFDATAGEASADEE